MALNFLTGSRSSSEDAAPETPESEPTTDTTEESESAGPSRRRRGSRGGRSRSGSKASASATATAETAEDEPAAPRRAAGRRTKADAEEAPAAKPSRRRSPASKASAEDEEATPSRAPRRRAPAARANEEAVADEQPKRAASPRRRSRAAAETEETGDAALLAALAEQTEALSRLVQLQEQTISRLSGNGNAGKAGAPPRVGVFVDSANVELARDRSRGGRPIDWGLVLERVTEGRRLVRANAYSPVHDDPGVSRETQRFVEPFLGKGYKIVTKPLKRFADGSIKANVDIELALDLITMADRLDIAVLISGDGDFQHLVEALQSRGVRVEVAGLGQSVASSLKNAADQYIELDFAQKK